MIAEFIAWYEKASSADRITANVLIGWYLMCLAVFLRVLWELAAKVL